MRPFIKLSFQAAQLRMIRAVASKNPGQPRIATFVYVGRLSRQVDECFAMVLEAIRRGLTLTLGARFSTVETR